jgi:hypothetical protein
MNILRDRGGWMAAKETEGGQRVVCEVFGIKITTNNPNIARILTTDVNDLANLDVREISSFLEEDPRDGGNQSNSE